jgi:hypothetical protein
VAAAGPSSEANAEALNGQEAATTEYSFDALAKGFAEGKLSRRKALRMLGGALVGGMLASVPGGAWAAKPAPCPSGKKCGRNCCPDSSFVCKQGKCVATPPCPAEPLSLCCECFYYDDSGDISVTSCQILRSTTTCHVHSDCEAVCAAATPPPGFSWAGGYGSGGSCDNFAGTNSQHICVPNRRAGQTGTVCGVATCSAGT